MKSSNLLALLSASLFSTGCNKPPDDHNHPQLSTGKQLFDHHCAECHQESAKGKFFYGYPDLVESTLNRDGIVKWIQGKEVAMDSKMHAFKSMPEHEAELIADYIISLR